MKLGRYAPDNAPATIHGEKDRRTKVTQNTPGMIIPIFRDPPSELANASTFHSSKAGIALAKANAIRPKKTVLLMSLAERDIEILMIHPTVAAIEKQKSWLTSARRSC